jgi:hypothetical protein
MTEVAATPEHAHDPAFRCSPWTQAQAVDPIGSAGSFDALLLVEWPLPWPKDVSDVPALADHAAHPGARLMMVVPQGEDHATRTVVHRWRTGTNRLDGVDHRVPADEVPALLATLLEDPQAPSDHLPSAAGPAPLEVLVCAHGRRDPCCGRWGTILHAELLGWGDVRVWRCSHTGGHRFAPTAITLPDGRAWAYVDAPIVSDIVRRSGDVHALAEHDRGSTGVGMWEQVVERALFERVGWTWLDHQVTSVATSVADDRQSAEVILDVIAPDGSTSRAVGRVEVTRVLPVLVCGEPPERATKSSPELALRSLELTTTTT